MTWTYNNPTNTIWTSFDYGEVEADSYEEATVKAMIQVKQDLRKVNDALDRMTSSFSIEMDLSQLEVTLKS